MTTDSEIRGRIGPDVDVSEIALTPAMGERFQTLYDGETPPTSVGEWLETMADALAVAGDRPTVDDLCAIDDGDHEFVGPDGREEFVCVLDPLAYPFLTGTAGTVRSTTPVREATVTFELTEYGVDVSHEDAVVSLGVSDHVEYVDELTPEALYTNACGYIQTFEDESEYETWAENVDAATRSLPAEEGVAVAREIATQLFGRERTPSTA